MSATYTLHLPSGAEPGDPAQLDRAVLVRDSFSLWACLAPALWFLWHRHVVLAAASVLAVGGLGLGLSAAGIRPGAVMAAEILLHVLVGLEAASLRRLALTLRGRPAADLVIAADEDEAAQRAFARWLGAARAAAPVLLPAVPPGSAVPPVPAMRPAYAGASREPGIIGLFPDREGRR